MVSVINNRMYRYISCIFTFYILHNTLSQECKNVSSIRSYNGIFKIYGFFPIHNEIPLKFSYKYLMLSTAFTYTVNKMKSLYRSLRMVEYIAYDSCGLYGRDVLTKSLLNLMIDGNHSNNSDGSCRCLKHSATESIIGIVGASYSSNSKYVSSMLSAYGIPIISYASTSVELSNKEEYPNFLRTIIPDGYQAKVISDILLYYGWTYVSIIATDESYGRHGRAELHREFKMNNICIAVDILYNIRDNEHQIRTITEQLHNDYVSNVVIVWALNIQAKQILLHASHHQLHNKTWLFSEAVGLDRWYLSFDHQVLRNALFITTYSGKDKDFLKYFWSLTINDSYHNHWLKTFFDTQNLTKSVELTTTLLDFKDYFD